MTELQDVQIIKSFRRSIGMHIELDGSIVVRAPHGMPNFLIKRFLEGHVGWIDKHRKILAERPVTSKKKFEHGESFPYLGKPYQLHIGTYKTITIVEDKILFPEFLRFRIQKEMTNWYQKQAREIIQAFVHEHTQIMGVSYTELYFSDTTSKWGSCSFDNKLQFNWRLIMAPSIVIRYVVIHELVHTVVKNHSREFWAKVGAHNPSYRQQRKWLRDHGHTLHEM